VGRERPLTPFTRRAYGLVALALALGACAPVDPAPAGAPQAARRGGRAAARVAAEIAELRQAVERGEGRTALARYEREAQEAERRGERLAAAKAYNAVAFIGLRLGTHDRGIRSGKRALELLEAEPPELESLLTRLRAHLLVGQNHRQVHDLVAGRRHFEAGVQASRALPTRGASLNWSANFAHALARVALAEGDWEGVVRQGTTAIRATEERLALLDASERRGGGGRARGARAFEQRQNAERNLAQEFTLVAMAETHLGRLDAADASLRRALTLARSVKSGEAEAQTLYALGRVALARKDPQGAAQRFEEGLALTARLDRRNLEIFLEDGLGRALTALGRPAEALAALGRAIDLVDRLRGELADADFRSGFVEDKQVVYHQAIFTALRMRRVAEAFGFAERARARAFLDLLGTQTVVARAGTRQLADEEARLRTRLTLARPSPDTDDTPDGGGAVGDDPSPATRSARTIVVTEYQAFVDRIRRENREQAALMAVEPVTLQEVQGLLPEGVTLLEYVVTANQTLLWVVDRATAEVVRLPVRRDALVAEVRAFRRAIAEPAPLEEVRGRAAVLYDRLLAAARPRLRGDRLLIVPHDVLHYVPFGALSTPEGRWLMEEYTLATLPSASVLRYLGSKGVGAPERVLVMGNPALGPALDLPYAEREARAVGALHPTATVLLRGDATESALKALSREAGLIHLAMHGELDEREPLASALMLAPGDRDDGRLEVREILRLELNARLVVLSACETALGRLSRGDELVGLQRAFLYAGTPAVVATLWKVEDRASYELMRAFHGALARGPAQALREAQRQVLGQFPHPFFWAAFGLTGMP